MKSKLKKVMKMNNKGDLAIDLSKKKDSRKELQHAATDDSTKDSEITWLMVGHLLDKFFFCAFLGGEIFFSITFLLPLYFRAKSP